MATKDLNVGGLEPSKLYEKLIEKGVTQSDAAILVGDWILKTFGHGERHFTYTAPVPPKDNCANTFQQQFHHQDWVDGVSVVQAGKTVGEDGFNDRMHRIQDDIAALSNELTKAVACVAELRKQVAAALEEVKIELNKLDGDVFELQQFANRGGRFGDTVVGGIKGGSFLGVADFLGDRVTVWKGPDGDYFTLPGLQMFGGTGGTGPKVNPAPDIAKFIEDTPEVRDTFRDKKFTAKDFEDKFGDRKVDGGPTIKELVDILPQDKEFESLDAMVKDAAERGAAVIKATNSTDAFVATTLTGLGAGVADVSKAPVSRLDIVPTEARSALVAAGFDTVDKLAAADAAEIKSKLGGAGVNVTAGDVASWKGTALTMNALARGIGR